MLLPRVALKIVGANRLVEHHLKGNTSRHCFSGTENRVRHKQNIYNLDIKCCSFDFSFNFNFNFILHCSDELLLHIKNKKFSYRNVLFKYSNINKWKI